MEEQRDEKNVYTMDGTRTDTGEGEERYQYTVDEEGDG